MADMEFEVAKKPKGKPITFTLGDDPHTYKFSPPKSAIMMMPVVDPQVKDGSTDDTKLELTKATFDWLGGGLSEKDRELLIKRLKDPEDDLDVDTLSEVVKKLTEKVNGRPTT